MGIEALVGVGLAISAAGTVTSTMGAMDAAEQNQKIASLEKQQLEQQKKQMDLQYRRSQMEAFRNQQKARALALTTASSQGAQFGSSLMGAYGQVSGQSYNNLLALDQNYAIGTNMYGLNQGISDARISLANAQSISAFGSGLSSLGGSLIKGAPTFAKITGIGAPNLGYSENNTWMS